MRRPDAAIATYLPDQPPIDIRSDRRLPRVGVCPECASPLRDHPRCHACGRFAGHRATDRPDSLCGECAAAAPTFDADGDGGWPALAVAVLRVILSTHRPAWFARPQNASWVRFWCDVAGLDPVLFFDRIDKHAGRKRRAETAPAAPAAA